MKKHPLDKLFEGISQEQLEEILSEAISKMPKHTKNCMQIIVGGVRPSCPDHPDFYKGPRKKWCCSEDCPLKGKDF